MRLIAKQYHLTGFHPGLLLRSLKGVPPFLRDLSEYRRKNDRSEFRVRLTDMFPILTDREAAAGTASGAEVPAISWYSSVLLPLAGEGEWLRHFCAALTFSRETGPYLRLTEAPRAWSLNLPVRFPQAGSAADCPCQMLLEPSRSGFRPTLWCIRVARVFRQFSRFRLGKESQPSIIS